MECSKIESALRLSLSGRRPEQINEKGDIASLGIVSDMLQSWNTCSLCRKLCDVLDLSNPAINGDAYVTFRRYDHGPLYDNSTFIMMGARPATTSSHDEPPEQDESMAVPAPVFKFYVDSPIVSEREICLVASPPLKFWTKNTPYRSQIRPIDRDAVDVGFARRCIEACSRSHGNTCGEIDDTIIKIRPPIYLLDLQLQCLVRSTIDADYVALSYVWGPAEAKFECRTHNLERFMQPGSMQDRHFFKVPALIHSAIEFTQNVGKRYLWIDRYCIIQDNGRHKHELIAAMGVIYARACFTIASLTGDARRGIPGLTSLANDRSSKPRRQANVFYHTDEYQVLYGVLHKSIPSQNDWTSRGWTFQEQMLSPRMAIFIDGKFVWRCKAFSCQEDFTKGFSTKRQNEDGICDSLISPGWPNMALYQNLVERYTRRTLSFPCDSIFAFSGILSSLNSSFLGGFIFGLPEIYFDVALLWQPLETLQDRKLLAEAIGKSVEPLPTWSWCRWQGKIDFGHWAAASECLLLSSYQQTICKTIPVVNWFKTEPHSGVREPILNWHSAYRGRGFAQHLHSSPGWKMASDGLQHKNIHPPKTFRFPVPILSKDRAFVLPQRERVWDTRISGTVEHAYLFIGDVIDDRRVPGRPVGWRYLHTGSAEPVGVISDTGLLQFQGNDGCLDKLVEADLIECIAISKAALTTAHPAHEVGISQDRFFGWEIELKNRAAGVYRFYNIMCIHRKDNVAFRRAVGRVSQDLWDGLRPDEIDIVLG
jgi:hypothetical protein